MCTSMCLLFYGRLLHAAAYPSTSFPLQFKALLLVKVGCTHNRNNGCYHLNELLNEISTNVIYITGYRNVLLQ